MSRAFPGLLFFPSGVRIWPLYLNDFMMHRVRNRAFSCHSFTPPFPATSDAHWVRGGARPASSSSKTVPPAVSSRPEYDEIWGKPTLAAKCRAVQLFRTGFFSPGDGKKSAGPCCPWNVRKTGRSKGFRGCPASRSPPVGSPCAAAAQGGGAFLPERGSARVPIEKSGRSPALNPRGKPSCLGEMTGSTIPWRQPERAGRGEGPDSNPV